MLLVIKVALGIVLGVVLLVLIVNDDTRACGCILTLVLAAVAWLVAC